MYSEKQRVTTYLQTSIKEDLPALKGVSQDILSDLNEGKLDKFFKN